MLRERWRGTVCYAMLVNTKDPRDRANGPGAWPTKHRGDVDMTNASGRPQLPRLPDVPEKAYEAGRRRGDPLSLAALRSHLNRCQDCQAKKPCERRTLAVKVYSDSVKVASGKSLRARHG